VIAAGYSFVSEKASHRAMLSFHHVVGVRILPDKELTSFFVKHGMPLDDALRTRTGKSGLEDGFWRNKEPRFAKYRAWASGSGRTWLVLSMVLEAPHYRDLMYKDLPSLLKADLSYYDTQGTYKRLPHTMPLQLGGPTTRKGLTVWTLWGLGALAAIAWATSRRKRGYGVLVFAATALFIPYFEMYFTWVGDPIEMPRHMIGALSRMSVILVIVVAIAADMVVSSLREDGTSERAPVEAPGETVDA
jgi:hypothetical protein